MRALRSIAIGLGIAILSTSIVLGSLSLAMLEGTISAKSPTAIESPATSVPSATLTINPIITLTNIPASNTPTLPPTLAACPPPAGWIPVTVRTNENLAILAGRYNINTDQLIQANCLKSGDLTAGSILYMPPLPTATPISCGPPSGWIIYIVKPKDNLYQISTLYQTTVPRLQAANCLGSSTLIIAGQALYVPNVATITPSKTFTPTIDPTPPLTGNLNLSITSSTANFSAPGVTLNFTYKLMNKGTGPISGPFTVTDNKLSVGCPVTSSLAPGASINCSGSYSSTQMDVDAGSVTVTATGHAFFNGSAIASHQATATVNAIQNSGLTLDKTTSTSSYVLAGDLISYTYNLKNTGNVTLSGPFTVNDDKTPVACPSTASLAPNTSINCTATYSATQGDVDNGSVTNIAAGQAFFKGNPVPSNQDSVTINATTLVGWLQDTDRILVSTNTGVLNDPLWICKYRLST